jgi:hypothetical protein
MVLTEDYLDPNTMIVKYVWLIWTTHGSEKPKLLQHSKTIKL